jgi:hypothetical protein
MKREGMKENAQTAREWVQFALIVFASVFGIYTFWYKDVHVPGLRPAALAISATVEEIGRNGDLALIRARVHAVNRSDVRVYAPAFWYTATGLRIRSTDLSVDEFKSSIEGALQQQGFAKFARYSNEGVPDVVAVWKLEDFDVWYDPKDETTNEELFYVPAGTYEAVRLNVEAVVAKQIAEFAPTQWNLAPDGSGSLTPLLSLRSAGYDRDHSKVEVLDAEKYPRQREWMESNGVGRDWAVATVSLKQTLALRNGGLAASAVTTRGR